MAESERSNASNAGDNDRSSAQLAREHDRLKLLLDINNATVSHLALDDLLHAISESLKRVIPHDISGIGLYDPETRQLRAHVLEYSVDLPIFSRGTPIPMEGTTGGLAFTTGQPVFVNEPDFQRFNSDYARKSFEAGFNSGGSIPLIAHGRRLGVLGVASRSRNAFSQEDIGLLCQVANQIAIAVENSLNYEKAREAERELALRLDHLQLLLDVSNSVTSHLNLRELFHAISECLKKVIRCDGAGLTFYDSESRQLRAVALEPGPGIAGKLPVELGEPFELEGTPGERAITTGRSVLVRLADLEKGTSPVSQRAIAAGIKSGCAVPLISHGRVLGTLDVVSRTDDAFTEQDAEVLTRISGEIAIAVENALNFEDARLAQEQLARERDRLSLLLEVNSAVTGQLELQELIKVISVCLRRVINHDAASLTIYNPETNLLHFHALETQVLGENLLRDGAYYSIEDTPSGVAFTTRRTVLFNLPELEKFSMPLVKLIVANGLKSAVCTPLISQGRVLGTLDIGSLQKEFTEEEAELLSQSAGQIAIAVDNALNFDRAIKAEQQMARDRERSELLLEINNKIASSLDLRDLFKAISGCLRTVLHHDYADLGFYNAETNRMRLYAIDSENEVPHEQEGVWWSVDGTPAGEAIRLRQTIVRARHDPDEFPSELMTRAYEAGLRSGCAVPLISRDRVLGVLIVASGREAAFTAGDGELLTQIGVQVAMAVENAINFEAVRSAELQAARERDRSDLLLKVNNAIVSHLDLRELMYVVSSYLRNALRHDLVGLALYDPETNQLRASTYDFPDNQLLVTEGQPIPLDGSMTGLTFTSGKPVIVNRFDDERFPSQFNKSFREAGFKSGCCVPLIAHGRKLGTLGVTNYKEDVFSEEEMGLLVQIGNQIAIALENALAYREIESLKNKLSEESSTSKKRSTPLMDSSS